MPQALSVGLTTEPDRSPPVAVSSKYVCVALSRHIAHTVLLMADLHHKWVLFVNLGKRADAIGGEELILVQEVPQHTDQPLSGGDCQKVTELVFIQCV